MTTDIRATVLASYLDESPADIDAGCCDNEFECGRASYLVLTDADADEAARAAILDSLWAFNTSFLSSYIPELDDAGAAKAFDAMRERLCEDAAPLVRRMLGSRLDECIEDAISCDGRGHFLAGYDSEEREHEHAGQRWYIYRTN